MNRPPAPRNTQLGSDKPWRSALPGIAYGSFACTAVLLLPLVAGLILQEGAFAMIGMLLFMGVLSWGLPGVAVVGVVSSYLGRDWRLLVLSILALVPSSIFVNPQILEGGISGLLVLISVSAYVILSTWWCVRWFAVAKKGAASWLRLLRQKEWGRRLLVVSLSTVSLIAAIVVVAALMTESCETLITESYETEWRPVDDMAQAEDEFGQLVGEFRFTGTVRPKRSRYPEGAFAWRCRVSSSLKGTALIDGRIRQSKLDEIATVSASCKGGYLIDRGGPLTLDMPDACTCSLRDAGGLELTSSWARLQK